MRLKCDGITIIVIVGVACCVGYLSSQWLDDDSLLEEFCEDVIEDQIGLDIDFSTDSPE